MILGRSLNPLTPHFHTCNEGDDHNHLLHYAVRLKSLIFSKDFEGKHVYCSDIGGIPVCTSSKTFGSTAVAACRYALLLGTPAMQ